MANQFGQYLKAMRLGRGYGLRQFAEMIGLLPSNLSAIEHGRRKLPNDPERLRQVADALALVEGSADWDRFFFLARQPGQLPVPAQQFAELEWFPVICRALNELQPTEEELSEMFELIKRRRKRAENKRHDRNA